MHMGLANIFDVVVSVAMLLLAIRFMVQFADIERTSPYCKAIYQLTPVVDIFGRIFPTIGEGRINTAALSLMFLLRIVFLSGTAQLAGQHPEPLNLFFVGSVSLILDFLDMCQLILSASIVASLAINLVQSDRQIWGVLMQLSEPIIMPFRKFAPQMGMFDLGFMLAYGGLSLAEIFIKGIAKYLLHLH